MPLTMESLAFLSENHLQNRKDWYDAHKPEYKALVVEPMTELVSALADEMRKIDPDMITDPKKCISRLRRDTRFVRDKSVLYRDHIWFSFMRDKKVYNGMPGFFFQVSPDLFTYGCGYYHADTASMNSMRRLILRDDKRFLAADAAFRRQKTFILDGDRFKRDRYPEEAPEKKDWLNCKNICFLCNSTDTDLLFSAQLASRLAKDFAALAPVYDFLMFAETQKDVE